jgi:hypothetical protein
VGLYINLQTWLVAHVRYAARRQKGIICMLHHAKLLLTCLVGGPILISTTVAQQQPSLVVGPLTGTAVSGSEGGAFSPSTFEYRVSASSISNYVEIILEDHVQKAPSKRR